MIYKLARKNLKGQFLNYLVYFVSMTFAVLVYYCFNAITYNRILTRRAGQDIHIDGAMGFGSILIIIMILGFMLSANHFFLLKRNKEIATYQLIGMRKSKISLLFLTETLLLGILSLIAGLILGVIFSKLFSMVLVKAMFLQVDSPFSFSLVSIVQTSLVFIFMLLVVSMRSTFLIYRYRLSKVLEQNEKKAIVDHQLTIKNVLFSFLGIVFILAGYFLAYHIIDVIMLLLKSWLGESGLFFTPLFILFCCLSGTYLFYRYTIYLVVFLLSKAKFSHRHLNMLALENTRMHIQRGTNRLYIITIFVATALSMIGGATSFYTLGMRTINTTDPVDFIVTENYFEKINQIIEKEDQGEVLKTVTLNLKLMGSQIHYAVGRNKTESASSVVNILSLSNYQTYQSINPYLKDIHLVSDDSVVILDNDESALGGILHYQSPVILTDGKILSIQSTQSDYLGQNLLRYNVPTIVVSDQQFAEIHSEISYKLIAFNSEAKNEEVLSNKIVTQVKSEWQNPIKWEYEWKEDQLLGSFSRVSDDGSSEVTQTKNTEMTLWQLNYTSRFPELRYQRRVMGLFIYVAMFLGILALIISGSILMLQQFSEAEREKSSYDLLKKIGIPKSEITRLVFQQNSIVFFPPMVIGMLHAIFAIYVFSSVVSSSGYWLAYLSCGLLILIYVMYYLLTSAIYCRIVHKNEKM